MQREVQKVQQEVHQVKEVLQDLQTSLLDLLEQRPTASKGKGMQAAPP